MNHFDFFMESISHNFTEVRLLKISSRGKVSLLRHNDTGTPFIYRTFRGDAEVYKRLLTISCPNLPEIFEVAQKGGEVAVLEEYVQGDTLSSMLDGGLFSPAETREIIFELCKGLYVLHAQGIIHRDIKPENVILHPQQPVLIDFDAARIEKVFQTGDTQVLGTTGYAAPEQFGIHQTDTRADIYALGILMNVMLTGKHPSVELAKGNMGRIVSKCTMIAPEKRYRSISHLVKELS